MPNADGMGKEQAYDYLSQSPGKSAGGQAGGPAPHLFRGKFDSVTYKYLQDSQSRMEQEK